VDGTYTVVNLSYGFRDGDLEVVIGNHDFVGITYSLDQFSDCLTDAN